MYSPYNWIIKSERFIEDSQVELHLKFEVLFNIFFKTGKISLLMNLMLLIKIKLKRDLFGENIIILLLVKIIWLCFGWIMLNGIIKNLMVILKEMN